MKEEEAMTNHLNESKAFEYADNRIHDLLDKLKAKRVCGCCTSRAMIFNAAVLCEQTLGSTKAAELLEDILDTMRSNNVPMPDYEGEGMLIEDDDSVH
jgi:hypothetical protein